MGKCYQHLKIIATELKDFRKLDSRISVSWMIDAAGLDNYLISL